MKLSEFVVTDLHFGMCGDWSEYYGATVFFDSGWFVYGGLFGLMEPKP